MANQNLVFKFLARNGTSPIAGDGWDMPTTVDMVNWTPGDWHEVNTRWTSIKMCRHGFHAFNLAQMAFQGYAHDFLVRCDDGARRLYLAEVGGDTRSGKVKMVAERMRLLRPITATPIQWRLVADFCYPYRWSRTKKVYDDDPKLAGRRHHIGCAMICVLAGFSGPLDLKDVRMGKTYWGGDDLELDEEHFEIARTLLDNAR